MNNRQLDKIGMLWGVNNFFEKNASVFNPLPHFAPVINALKNITTDIGKEEVLISTDMSGYTIAKQDARSALEELSFKVATALHSYGLVSSDPDIIAYEDYQVGSLSQSPDCELFVLGLQLHAKAAPVEASLPPYGIGPADVAALLSRAQEFLPLIKVTRDNRRNRSRGVKKIAALFRAADLELDKADAFMAVYYSVNPNLWSRYQSARKIEKKHGGHHVHSKQGKVRPAYVSYVPFADKILKATSRLELTNDNRTGNLVFYFASKPGTLPVAQTSQQVVPPQKSVVVKASDAGYTAQTPFLHVHNPNVRNGQWKAEIKKTSGK